MLRRSVAGLARLRGAHAPLSTGVFVTVNVPEDKRDEFLKVMKIDAAESRKEPGCVRFDLLGGSGGAHVVYQCLGCRR